MISHLTFLSTSSALTMSLSYPSIGTASFISSTRNTLFIHCSAYIGHATIRTPLTIASSVEFHPQCVTNPPTDPCSSTSAYGAHDFTTSPLPLVLSRNPSGSMRSRSGSGGASNSLSGSPLGGLLTTHRNLCPLLSSPTAISFSCSEENNPMLPKQRKTTDFFGCASSQAKHSDPPLLLSRSRDWMSGPIQK
ncbi:anthocyanidin 5,3-O-glucosyltransferase [Iris pallida]|uniref:Anthocyanidin 5,3-O-glucosyltransferase n=1 Tax=Iris pallida TaxID=29817 RepID=A0AAX6GPT5_IRIPA|nr:anthocyanidin 5,3-O-glucosyltransferase [Iris pallida]